MYRILLVAVVLWSCSDSGPTSPPDGERVLSEVRDDQYLSGAYYFLHSTHREMFPRDPASVDQVDVGSVRVFLDVSSNLTTAAFAADAFSRWDDAGEPVDGPEVSGTFFELDRDAYLADARGYLILTGIRVSRSTSVAVVFRTRDGRRFGSALDGQGGDVSTLRLVQRSNQTADDPTWGLMWKNVYSLGGVTEDASELLAIRIFKDADGDTIESIGGVSLATLLGIDPDRLAASDLPGVNRSLGHLILPHTEPFTHDVLGPTGKNHAIYNVYPSETGYTSLYRIQIEWIDIP